MTEFNQKGYASMFYIIFILKLYQLMLCISEKIAKKPILLWDQWPKISFLLCCYFIIVNFGPVLTCNFSRLSYLGNYCVAKVKWVLETVQSVPRVTLPKAQRLVTPYRHPHYHLLSFTLVTKFPQVFLNSPRTILLFYLHQ